MTSLTMAWCLNSFQLRLAFSCRKPPAVFSGMRVRKLERHRIHLFLFAGNCVGRRNTWVNSTSSVDGLGGWPETDDVAEKSVDSKGKKQSFAGIVVAGAGSVGVILVTALTFAALCIGKRNSAILYHVRISSVGTWKMALEKRQLPVVDQKSLQKVSGWIDTGKIHPDMRPPLVADLSSGEWGIITLAFGYTRLFQPYKPVTKGQAAIALATGEASDTIVEELSRIEAESIAEKAVASYNSLAAQVEKDVNASFEKEFILEKKRVDTIKKLAEEARQELESLRAERKAEHLVFMKERAAVDSELEVLSRFRHEVEERLQSLKSDKIDISYEKERLGKFHRDAEIENQEIARLQYELEVERKALSIARAWAEGEAKRAREREKTLEAARDRWERQGINKMVVDNDIQEELNIDVTWLQCRKSVS